MTNKLNYFVGNWKMFGDFRSLKIIYRINNFLSNFNKIHTKNKIIFCIPNTLISFYSKKLKSNFISLGVQNCHYNETYGPFTGSVSASMLKKAGAKYVILGHSENRLTGDSNKLIKKKTKSASNQKLKIILCIGESYNEKKNGKTFIVLKKQISKSIDKKCDLSKIIIAYEPIWSIGTGKVPKIYELEKTFKFIKYQFKKIFKTRKTPIVLYGGSVNEKNVRNFSSVFEIDGFLIGGASQSSKKFIDIMKNYYK
tara:strand:- start:274 stop:1035 length:762 start_codon:yes stop_codon:yes gene_type:complete